MSAPSNAMPQSPLQPQPFAPALISPGRRLYWSIRRELWENRSIFIAPLAVAALILVGSLISAVHLAGALRAASQLTPLQQRQLIERPYNFAALLIMGTTFIVAIFYSLEALHGERRDRSILFWKSLPVSDLTTVLSKASIPLLVLPLLTFAITIATQWIMLLIASAVLLSGGLSVAALWTQVSFFDMSAMLLYHLIAIHALWYAPIWGWLLLVSAWARRAAFLWAVLPLLAIGIVERIAFNTSYLAALLRYRIGGGPDAASFTSSSMSMNHMTHVDPFRFLATPGLWTGLALTAVFLAAAVRLRHHRGPI